MGSLEILCSFEIFWGSGYGLRTVDEWEDQQLMDFEVVSCRLRFVALVLYLDIKCYFSFSSLIRFSHFLCFLSPLSSLESNNKSIQIIKFIINLGPKFIKPSSQKKKKNHQTYINNQTQIAKKRRRRCQWRRSNIKFSPKMTTHSSGEIHPKSLLSPPKIKPKLQMKKGRRIKLREIKSLECVKVAGAMG